MRGRHLLGTPLVTAAIAISGCGGDSPSEVTTKSTPTGPPPPQQVEKAVVAIIDACTKRTFDATVDTSPVSEQVDQLISLFKAHDPDATLGESDLRATTMRQALTQVRDNVRSCSPADEDRVNETLTSLPAPPDAEPAPTLEAEETSAPTKTGVAGAAAELAPLCVDKIGAPGPASPEIEAAVDELVAAYASGPKNSSTKRFMRVASDNLTGGCGPDQAAKVKAALDG